jgi:hypothetical protein
LFLAGWDAAEEWREGLDNAGSSECSQHPLGASKAQQPSDLDSR